MFVLGMAGLIYWEWNNKAPIMNIKLFKYKNFAICCLLMALVGGVLNASTVLQPQFMQSLLGYTATIAGEALTGGGIALVFVMAAGRARRGQISSAQPRRHRLHILRSRLLLELRHHQPRALLRLQRLSPLHPDDPHPVLLHLHHKRGVRRAAARSLQPRFPASSTSCATSAAASSSPITGAIVTNRSLFHQARLQNAMQPGNPIYVQQVNALTAFFRGIGGNGAATAHTMAQANLYGQLQQQAEAMAYQDIFRMLFWMSCVLVGLAFLLSKNRPGQGAPAGEAVH